jgi:hypothetical protein
MEQKVVKKPPATKPKEKKTVKERPAQTTSDNEEGEDCLESRFVTHAMRIVLWKAPFLPLAASPPLPFPSYLYVSETTYTGSRGRTSSVFGMEICELGLTTSSLSCLSVVTRYNMCRHLACTGRNQLRHMLASPSPFLSLMVCQEG